LIDAHGVMTRSDVGIIAEVEWWRAAALALNVDSPAFVLMPNHVHGILYLNPNTNGGYAARSLPDFVGRYKAAVSRQIGHAIWQRSFYDRIIRDDQEFEALQRYIESNPAKWAEDQENPVAVRAGPVPPPRPAGGMYPAPTARR
jgi:REP element-mobilizing transposase RayT